MCESAAYIKTFDGEKIIMENIIHMKIEPGKIHLVDLLGNEKTITGVIDEIKLLDHKIFINESKVKDN